jgi:hypothetical protein
MSNNLPNFQLVLSLYLPLYFAFEYLSLKVICEINYAKDLHQNLQINDSNNQVHKHEKAYSKPLKKLVITIIIRSFKPKNHDI